MFHCPMGVWVIEQRAIIFSATVRSPTVIFVTLGFITQTLFDKTKTRSRFYNPDPETMRL